MDWKKGIRKQPDLKIDCDTHRRNPIKRFNFRAKYLMQYYPDVSPMKIVVYKTKKGFHFYVYTKHHWELGKDKVTAQLILGSDWLRELRNLYRLNQGDVDWNLMFSEKDKNGKMQYEKFYCAYVLK